MATEITPETPRDPNANYSDDHIPGCSYNYGSKLDRLFNPPDGTPRPAKVLPPAVTPETMNIVRRFGIYESEHPDIQYKTVVLAEDYDALYAEVQDAREANAQEEAARCPACKYPRVWWSEDPCQPTGPGKWVCEYCALNAELRAYKAYHERVHEATEAALQELGCR